MYTVKEFCELVYYIFDHIIYELVLSSQTHDQPCNVSTRAVSFCGSRARVIMI